MPAILHNVLLMENEPGECFYEDDSCTSDLDTDKELKHPVGDEESHHKRRSQLTAHFAKLMLQSFENKICDMTI